MYLLFVDESGTHGGSHSFVLGALAVHEDDAARLQKALDSLVIKHLGRVPVNLDEYELHAQELRNAKQPKANAGLQRVSIWARFSRKMRLDLLEAAYELLTSFKPANPLLAHSLFGVAVDSRFHPDWSSIEREQFAYEVLLNKFDVMLKNLRVERSLPNRGLVIHDRRVVAEADIQAWTSSWRAAAGDVGQLRNLADVPLFSDSRATRLLQVADLVSYALYRRYDPSVEKNQYFETIWPLFHSESGVTHGCVHYSPSFGSGDCDCEPCQQRLIAEALQTPEAAGRHRGPRQRRQERRKGSRT